MPRTIRLSAPRLDKHEGKLSRPFVLPELEGPPEEAAKPSRSSGRKVRKALSAAYKRKSRG